MRPLLFILILLCMLFSCASDSVEPIVLPCDTIQHDSSSYVFNIKTIIDKTCANIVGCHGSTSSNGDYTSFNSLEVILENGKFESEVIDSRYMPLVPPSIPLTTAEYQLIKCWYENGFKEK